ncbi:MAG: isochorismate synthase [Candidatus Dadabacteria bacterium]|nr:MAG: isochorismate synthase [Candidatus Dadabacteria bacterium]
MNQELPEIKTAQLILSNTERLGLASVTLDYMPDFINWLAETENYPKFHWRNRTAELEIAAAGIALGYSEGAGDKFSNLLIKASDLMHSSGLSGELALVSLIQFDGSSHSTGLWEGFPVNTVFLPNLYLLRKGTTVKVVRAARIFNDNQLEELKQQLQRDLLTFRNIPLDCRLCDAKYPGVISSLNLPEWPGWQGKVKEALDEIKGGQLRKIVLGRRTDYTLEDKLDPYSFYRVVLPEAQRNYQTYYSPSAGGAFISLSPELLLAYHNGTVSADVMGGTVARGAGPQEESANTQELCRSAKLRLEHNIIRDELLEKFRRDLTDVNCRDLEVVKLSSVQHLHSVVSGSTKSYTTALGLLSEVHPTAAVAGIPRRQAISRIRELEPFHRGLYTGFAGVFLEDSFECNVLIRSALVRGNKLSVFAGCGIVAGSQAKSEWHELDIKTEVFKRCLSLTADSRQAAAAG